MRFLPLLSSRFDPEPWRKFPAVELDWAPDPHPGWGLAAAAGLEVHAVHLSGPEEALLDQALEVLRRPLGPDFLVLPAALPVGRQAEARFLGLLEALLEAGGPKVALRAATADLAGLRALLGRVRADSVGFCWDGAEGPELEAISDRLYCAVGTPEGDFAPLQRLGYRWNLAIPGRDPEALAPVLARLREAFPPVLFPAELPSHIMGRPVVPPEDRP